MKSKDANPTRFIERHSHNGNQTLDMQSTQVRGFEGRFEAHQDTETETLQVDATTVRTTTRDFGRNSNGGKMLLQVAEEEKQTLPGGDLRVLRTISTPDTSGRLQTVRHEIVETRKLAGDAEETNTTVMLQSINGGLAPALKTHEVCKRGLNGTTEDQKSVLFPDGAGNWQVNELMQSITRQEGKDRITDERISRPDSEGKLSEVSRVVTKESEDETGEKRSTVETYSFDVMGVTRDGKLHLVERATTTQTSSNGTRLTKKQVEQINPDEPNAGLRISILSSDTVQTTPSGEQGARTIRARDANGSFGIVSIETTESDRISGGGQAQ